MNDCASSGYCKSFPSWWGRGRVPRNRLRRRTRPIVPRPQPKVLQPDQVFRKKSVSTQICGFDSTKKPGRTVTYLNRTDSYITAVIAERDPEFEYQPPELRQFRGRSDSFTKAIENGKILRRVRESSRDSEKGSVDEYSGWSTKPLINYNFR